MTLYELTEEFQRLYEVAEEDDPDALQDTLDLLNDDLEHKIDAYVAVIRSLDADAEALSVEIARLQARKNAIKTNKDHICKRMQTAMDALGKTKIKTALNTVSIQNVGGRLPVIINVGTEYLPNTLVKLKKEPDMEAIRRYLDEGNTEFAHYGERGRSLRIK